MNSGMISVNESLPLREYVFVTLRQSILKGELAPGERLMEIRIAERMGVSRTPVREAIHKLEKDGLVNIIPRKGAVVSHISEKKMKNVLAVRLTLDKMAYELCMHGEKEEFVKKLTEAEEDFEKAVAGGNPVDISTKDESFHFLIYQKTDNEILSEMCGMLKENVYRYRMEYAKAKETYPLIIEEHNRMIECIKNNNRQEGLNAVEAHIKQQEDFIIRKIQESGMEKRANWKTDL